MALLPYLDSNSAPNEARLSPCVIAPRDCKRRVQLIKSGSRHRRHKRRFWKKKARGKRDVQNFEQRCTELSHVQVSKQDSFLTVGTTDHYSPNAEPLDNLIVLMDRVLAIYNFTKCKLKPSLGFTLARPSICRSGFNPING